VRIQDKMHVVTQAGARMIRTQLRQMTVKRLPGDTSFAHFRRKQRKGLQITWVRCCQEIWEELDDLLQRQRELGS
jgi:hypothetical protein